MAPHLAAAFFDYYGYRVSESEARSWRNSLRAMADAVELGQLDDQGIAVEVQLPLSSGRLDCLLTGHTAEEHAQARAAGVPIATLGPTVLRTETAAIVAAARAAATLRA